MRLLRLDKLPTLTALVRDRAVRLAVTGLSHSGKTALITSIVYNLLGAVGGPARLPFLRAAADRRILAAQLLAPENNAVPQFPLDETIAALAGDPPHWPASTTDLRRVRLALRFSPAGLLGRGNPIGRAAGSIAEVTLDILDYPGEWLLDLPLLRQSYGEWSRATLSSSASANRRPASIKPPRPCP